MKSERFCAILILEFQSLPNQQTGRKQRITMSGDFRTQKSIKPANVHKKPPKAAGLLWQVLGIVLVIAGAIVFIINRGAISGYLPSIIIGTLSYLCMGGGIGLFNYGRKYSTPAAREILAQDKRKPVIYLRSFIDDPWSAQTHANQSFLAWETEEEQIAGVMKEIGPFIAIGNPREKLPELGAARAYVGDNEWQRTVSILISHAQLVVLRPGTTPGFMWEVETVAKSVKPERLLFLIPYEKEQYETFCQSADQYFPKLLPEYISPAKGFLNFFSGTDVAGLGSLRGIVYFEQDWTPRFIPLKIPSRQQLHPLHPLSTILKFAMKPVFEQLQIPFVTPIPSRIGANIGWTILIIATIFLGLLILSR
jgi:hypothetical protein